MRRGLYAGAGCGALLLLAAAGLAQRGRPGAAGREDQFDYLPPARAAEFHFLRLEYTDLPFRHRGYGYSSRDGRGSGWWMMDWPAAENHFSAGLQRLTRIDVGDPRHVSLLDDHLFDYPWIYATQAGYWDLSVAETARLREYLLRGGYLVTDDCWGQDEWEVFRTTMARVFPGKPILDIAQDDAVRHALYDIGPQDLTIIPGSRHLYRGRDGSAEIEVPQGSVPAWRAMFDDRGRMVVAANFNTDIGDAWEFADVPYSPAAMTMLAYRYGINYLLYSMTH
jgi:hypothetical protein